MSNLFLTLMIAFVVIVLAIACLAIGWLITGRSRIERSCGRDPTQKKDESCGTSTSCSLCEAPPKNNKKSDESTNEELQ